MVRPHAAWMLLFLGLFAFRVLAQLSQAAFPVPFLPPFEAWQSGALAYPYLLLSQVVLLAVLGRIAFLHARGRVAPVREKGRRIVILGAVYAGVMITRYVLHMVRFPAERWTGGSLPIFFHLALSGFVLAAGWYHLRNGASGATRPSLLARLSWRGIYGVLALGIAAWIAYQLFPLWLGRVLEARPASHSVRIDKGVRMDLGGGDYLVGDIYRPERLPRAPTVLVRIPLDRNLKGRIFSNGLGRFLGERGYNVVIQGVRGRYGSPGRHAPLTGEREDGIATLRWLRTRPWHDGRVGMWGGSYFGHTQWTLADQDSLGIRALMIQVASSRNAGMFHPGGAFAYESAVYWGLRSRGASDAPPDSATMARAFAAPPALDADVRATGDSIGYYRDWVRHGAADTFWRASDGVDRPAAAKAPILFMAGWFDAYLPTQVRDYEELVARAEPYVARESRLIIGPWGHAQTLPTPDGFLGRHYRLESIAPAVAWFDRHLKGRAEAKAPKVRLFVMGENAWRDAASFPLPGVEPRTFFLGAAEAASAGGHGQETQKGGVLREDSARETGTFSYRHDPSNPVPSLGGNVLNRRAGVRRQNSNEGRDDVLLFTSAPLEQDLPVIGRPRLVLHAGSDAPGADFVARLLDVFPDGGAYNVAEGVVRVDGTAPGRIDTLDIPLGPVANVFRKGHRIRVHVMSSCYPQYSIQFGAGKDNERAMRGPAAIQTLHTGSGHPSRLLLPVVLPEP